MRLSTQQPAMQRRIQAYLRHLLPKCILVASHLRGQVLVISLLALEVGLQDGHGLLIQVLILVLLQVHNRTENLSADQEACVL